jgi:hypothetical protein
MYKLMNKVTERIDDLCQLNYQRSTETKLERILQLR